MAMGPDSTVRGRAGPLRLLTKPDIGLSDKERSDVKAAARDLLATLKREKFVLDWRKRQQTRVGVIVTIEQLLDRQLPRIYTQPIWRQKCDAVSQHVYDSYFGPSTPAMPRLAGRQLRHTYVEHPDRIDIVRTLSLRYSYPRLPRGRLALIPHAEWGHLPSGRRLPVCAIGGRSPVCGRRGLHEA